MRVYKDIFYDFFNCSLCSLREQWDWRRGGIRIYKCILKRCTAFIVPFQLSVSVFAWRLSRLVFKFVENRFDKLGVMCFDTTSEFNLFRIIFTNSKFNEMHKHLYCCAMKNCIKVMELH